MGNSGSDLVRSEAPEQRQDLSESLAEVSAALKTSTTLTNVEQFSIAFNKRSGKLKAQMRQLRQERRRAKLALVRLKHKALHGANKLFIALLTASIRYLDRLILAIRHRLLTATPLLPPLVRQWMLRTITSLDPPKADAGGLFPGMPLPFSH